MKKIILTTLIFLSAVVHAHAADPVKVGIILGFTGPIESLTPPMASAAEVALQEASDSGKFLNGRTIESIRADSTCIDASAATTATERLITSDKVVAIMGPDCSGVTIAAVNNVAAPTGVVMVSPSATSPALSTIRDRGYFFRAVPSDARQGQVLSDILTRRGIQSIAVTYTNNDYGKGLVGSFNSAFRKAGGTITAVAAHEDGKADYASEVATLAASGADHLIIFGYVDQGGRGIIQAAIDTDAFDGFFGSDGMVGDSLIDALGGDVEGLVTSLPGVESAAREQFAKDTASTGLETSGPFVAESYDAAALIVLAIQAAGSTDRALIKSKMQGIANAPGVKIHYGELAKGLEILANGGDVDYVGITDIEFNGVGETNGKYREQEVRNGKYTTVQTH